MLPAGGEIAFVENKNLAATNGGPAVPADPVKALRDAVAWVQKHHPLPRCKHGSALRDGAGERLEPSCGCRARGGEKS